MTQSGHALLHCMSPLLTQSGHSGIASSMGPQSNVTAKLISGAMGSELVVLNHWRSNMMKFPSTLDEENLLTYQVSDEALETAGGNEIAGRNTLAYCTGVYCNFVVLRGSLFSAER